MKLFLILIFLTSCTRTEKEKCSFANGVRSFVGQQIEECK